MLAKEINTPKVTKPSLKLNITKDKLGALSSKMLVKMSKILVKIRKVI